MLVLNSSDPTRTGNSAGVAFVLNKEKINTSDAKMTTLIPGRAIALTIKWHGQKNYKNIESAEALRDFRLELSIQDTWQHTFPTTRMFTFNSNTNTMSRLDRIYTSTTHHESTSEWRLHRCSIPTDHNIVLVRFAPPGVPHIGKGRRSWPLGILSDKSLIDKIIKLGIKTQEKIERLTSQNRTETENPQTLWESLKTQMNSEAKETAKTHLAKINH
ncbi:hypothetical protein DFJ58DRAFT_718100 [Suillus subalutaceus]|uniref:uncharacterized protein n=1 Tax=Suillus subalutaceus TaxID=48586 RepID=UPI001B880DEA|nr:uncharacterized protein DFJ58DRAFT_718100 [Suillus subalutaceus]KAG1841799.1 hypothetical protein DFJ58DRAFT_718100 [Suillus subalutaceus]